MKRLITLFLLLTISYVAPAQVTLQGKVIDKEAKSKLSFANVVLFEISDTTKIYTGTMTDHEGVYRLEHLPVGRYQMVVSYVGYKPYRQKIRLSIPSSGNIIERNILLSKGSNNLGEVVVTANRIKQESDHQIILFSKEQKEKASYAKDLLATMPNIKEDVMSGNLSTMKGGGLLILVNGVKASDAQLKIIPPDKVVRVEYYDIPPARYAYVGTVINVITKTLDNGYALGAQTTTAFTTGFNNSNAYYSYTSGKHRFDIEYYLNYRNYKNRIEEVQYDYVLNGTKRQDYTLGKDAFGYTTHVLSLKYAFIESDKRIFQTTFATNYNGMFSGATYDGRYTNGSSVSQLKKMLDKNDKTWHPSLDLYYWNKLSDTDELTLNLNLNYFQTKGDNKHKEIDPVNPKSTYKDLMFLNNKKHSLIGEVVYVRNFSVVSKLSLGYKVEYSHLLSDLNNLLGASKYRSDYLQQYAYGELSGAQNRWIYRISLGLTHIYSKSLEKTYNRLLFTPQVILGYNLSQRNTLRLMVARSSVMPSISMLSSNAILLTKDIVKRGNPQLTSGSISQVYLIDSYNNRWVNLSLGAFYMYEDNPINQYFEQRNDKWILTYRNTQHNYDYGAFLQAQIKPLGNDILSIGIFSKPYGQRAVMPEGTYNYYTIDNQFSVNLNYKHFSAEYQYAIPNYSLSGIFRSLGENYNNLTLAYRLKNWKFSAGMLFIGQVAHYRSETITYSPVQYYDDRRIQDNKSMLIFGVSYNFRSGVQKKLSRKLNNTDNVAPSF